MKITLEGCFSYQEFCLFYFPKKKNTNKFGFFGKENPQQMLWVFFCGERGSVHYKYMSMFSGFSLVYKSIG